MARGAACTRIVLGVLLSFVAFGVVAQCALGLTLRGHRANNTIVVRATGVASGRYSIDGGRWVRFGGIHSLTIDGVGGHDVCRIVNPPRGLFAPRAGIACNGGNRPGAPRRGVLEVDGGRAEATAYSPRHGQPGAGTMTARRGRIVQVIRFSGLAPVTDTVPSTTFTFNDSASADDAEFLDGLAAGQNRIVSRTGQFESLSIANKANVTLNATTAGDLAELHVNQPETGMASLTVNSAGGVFVDQAILPGVSLHLTSNQDAVVETGPIVLGPGSLAATAATQVALLNPGNVVGAVSGNAANGSFRFSDDNIDPLGVGAVSASGDVQVFNVAGDLHVTGAVHGGSTSDVRLASRIGGGTVSLGGGAAASGRDVTLTADDLTLAGGLVHATGVATVQPFSDLEPIDLGDTVVGHLSLLAPDLAAITAGTMTIGNATSGQIVVTEPVSVAVPLELESAGGLTRTSAGTLSAPALALVNGGSTTRTWTITPTSVADGSGFSIPYTAATLGITGGSGGDTFGVSASPATAYALDGGPASNGTLTYDAQGRAVSGSSLVAPSGEIDSPTVKPVTFTRMTAVHITGAATAGLTVALAGNGAGTVTDGGLIHCRPTCAHSYLLGTVVTLTATPAPGSRFAGWSGDGCSGLGACRVTLATSQSVRATFLTPPRCTLTAASSTVSHPRVRHPRPGQIPPATLTLRVRCNQAAAVRIAGTITERPRGHRTTVRIAPTRVNVGAGQTTSVTVTLPVSAARALAARVPESAAFTAQATSAGGTGRAALTLARLRP